MKTVPAALALSAIGGVWASAAWVATGLETAPVRIQHSAGLPMARVVTLEAPGAAMLRVARGEFAMGSTMKEIVAAAALCNRTARSQPCRPQTFSDEQPLHRVYLSSFWLDRTEVTVEQYERCVEQRRCRAPPYSEGASRFRQPRFPVTLVSWEDATNYCHWRGARLPTEAEFERASRGTARRIFPWGDLYNSHVSNHGRYGYSETDGSDGFEELAPVGSFANGRTPEGFMDLSGNVAEWTHDLYEPRYPSGPETNPTGPASTQQGYRRVTRGGHYRSAPAWLRGAAREPMSAGERTPYVGFRCARSGPRDSAS